MRPLTGREVRKDSIGDAHQREMKFMPRRFGLLSALKIQPLTSFFNQTCITLQITAAAVLSKSIHAQVGGAPSLGPPRVPGFNTRVRPMGSIAWDMGMAVKQRVGSSDV